MKPKPKKPTGKKPERFKHEGDWRTAVKQSFTKKKPKAGWPKIGGAF